MKTIVCGGSGFLGSHLADLLTECGHEVTILDRRPSTYATPSQRMVVADILDRDAVAEALRGTDAVYHLAGIVDLEEAAASPLDTVEQNVRGTVGLLEAAVAAGVKRFIYASTVYVYSQLGGFYRCSKQASELYIEEYERRHGLPYTILRYGTLYGPRADARNSVWRYLHQGLTQGKILFTGTGEEIREYVHVRDAARLSVDILAKEYANQHILITGYQPMKTRDMLRMIQEMLQGRVTIEYAEPLDNAHYTLTPYSFVPKIGRKLVGTSYIDMGQGLLECLHDIPAAHDAA
ncbi:MAG: NAD(P)-dependent oxidoreductase [Candidatus Omnitrophica bacterium]|nr:NAD(P)-dependent oxidoreductase [Candidatus Omnitrophota bacterium]